MKKKIEIEITYDEERDYEYALQEVMFSLQNGYDSGFNENNSSDYRFAVLEVEEEESNRR